MKNKEYIQELFETIVQRDIDEMERSGNGYCVHNMEYFDPRSEKIHVLILKIYAGKKKNEAEKG